MMEMSDNGLKKLILLSVQPKIVKTDLQIGIEKLLLNRQNLAFLYTV